MVSTGRQEVKVLGYGWRAVALGTAVPARHHLPACHQHADIPRRSSGSQSHRIDNMADQQISVRRADARDPPIAWHIANAAQLRT